MPTFLPGLDIRHRNDTGLSLSCTAEQINDRPTGERTLHKNGMNLGAPTLFGACFYASKVEARASQTGPCDTPSISISAVMSLRRGSTWEGAIAVKTTSSCSPGSRVMLSASAPDVQPNAGRTRAV